MDILTQGLLGATMAQAGARRGELRLATGIGLVAGLLADADVLIQSAADPLLQIEYHRHFTHSVFFVPLGALLAALLVWPVLRARLPLTRIYLYALLGYSLSGFLDTCTSYGTYWLWPLVDQRLALNIVSIIDPLFSLMLLIGVVIGWRGQSAAAPRLALLLAGGYLLLGWLQHERAQGELISLAAQRGHVVERALVKPTLGNLLLWRSIYETNGRFQVDALRVGLGPARIYPGASALRYRPEADPQSPPAASLLAADIDRFMTFSDGYVIRLGGAEQGLGDVRYAMLPTSTRPLWGIAFDPAHPERHAEYQYYRSMSGQERRRFVDMLLGRP